MRSSSSSRSRGGCASGTRPRACPVTTTRMVTVLTMCVCAACDRGVSVCVAAVGGAARVDAQHRQQAAAGHAVVDHQVGVRQVGLLGGEEVHRIAR